MTQLQDTEIIIRRAAREDRDLLADMARRATTAAEWTPAAYGAFFRRDEPGAQARALFVASLSSVRARPLANLDSTAQTQREDLLGFAAYSAVLTPEFAECEVENMATAAEWRRRGIARRLLRAGMLWCAAYGAARIHLEVRASNAAAIALYQNNGFVARVTRKAYYAQPVEDAVCMDKR